MPTKIYVDVLALWDKNGKIIPRALKIDDVRYNIDKVLDTRPATSLKAELPGTRYTIRVEGRDSHLFFDGTQWFVFVD